MTGPTIGATRLLKAPVVDGGVGEGRVELIMSEKSLAALNKKRQRENPTRDENRSSGRTLLTQQRMKLRPPDLCLIKLSHLIRPHICYRKHRPPVRTSQGAAGIGQNL